MLKKRNLWPVGGVFLLLTMVLSACGGGSSGPSTGGNTPVKGGTVIDGISQNPNSLLPQRSNQTFSLLVQAAIRTPLFYSTDKATLAPGIATDVPSTTNGGISADGKTYTFKLRTGLKWSDGQPLNADDVVYTINLFKDPKYSTKDGFPGDEIANVAEPDQNTVVLTLNKVDAAFLNLGFVDVLAFSPLPKHVYSTQFPSADKLIQSNESFQPTVSNGPFTVSERVQGDHITVKRNPNYYLGPDKPYLDSIIFKNLEDATTEVTALQAKQIDTAYFIPVSSYDQVSNIPGYKLTPSTQFASFEAWYFNLTNPILSDVKVREALAISFDTKKEITNLWHSPPQNLAKPTCDEAVGTFAHNESLIDSKGYCSYGPDQKSFDNGGVDAAKALLDQAGWVPGSDGIRVKGGQRLSLRIATTTGRKYREDSEALAQDAWKAIGVELKVDNHPSGDLFGPILFPTPTDSASGNNKFDIAEFATGPGTDPDNRLLYDSKQIPQAGGSNLMFYSNPTVDQLVNQQVTVVDQAQRKALFTQIQQQVQQDVPIIWLYSFANINVNTARLHNYAPSGEGPDETWNTQDWWLTGGKR